MLNVKFLLFATIIAGILFGYTSAVISGAIPFLHQEFALTSWDTGLLVSILIIGMLTGSLFTGKLSDYFGRKKTFLLNMALFFVTSLFVFDLHHFIGVLFFRFVSGVAMGISASLLPVYVAELSPPEKRGYAISYFQLAITIGILLAFGASYLFYTSGSWRGMFSLNIGFSLIGLLLYPKLIDSPVSEKKTTLTVPFRDIFKKKYSKMLLIGAAISFFQQSTGINTITFYVHRILLHGSETGSSLVFLLTNIIGFINVLLTIAVVFLVDKIGRRPLLLIGTFGMFLSLILVAFTLDRFPESLLAFVGILFFVGFFAISLGPIAYILIAEVFPDELRARASALSIFIISCTNYTVSLLFLPSMDFFGSEKVFLFFATLSLLAYLFCLKKIPETKGKSFKEIQRMLS